MTLQHLFRPLTARRRVRDLDGALLTASAYQSASICVKCAHFSGTSSAGKIAWTGHTGTHAPQSMQVSGSM